MLVILTDDSAAESVSKTLSETALSAWGLHLPQSSITNDISWNKEAPPADWAGGALLFLAKCHAQILSPPGAYTRKRAMV